MPRRKRIKPSEVLAAAQVEANHFDLSELAHEYVAKMGGVKMFVAEHVQEYQASKQGTIARYKLWDSMVRIVLRAAEQQAPQTEAGDMSDDELHEAMLSELEKRGMVVEEEDTELEEDTADAPRQATQGI